jgi:hypothetical protein
MPDPDDRRLIQFDKLNLLGKAVFIAGTAVRTTASLIEVALEKTVDLVEEAERAFQQGRDPNIDEAKILEEHERDAQK